MVERTGIYQKIREGNNNKERKYNSGNIYSKLENNGENNNNISRNNNDIKSDGMECIDDNKQKETNRNK